MYHVGPIGLAALIIYLLSLYLSASGFISKKTHRKFWNWVLFVTFIFTALLGLFMALQISYKWNIPVIKQILHLHVEFGIGMSFAAIIHLTWHLKYYFGGNNGQLNDILEQEPVEVHHSPLIRVLLMITGFTSSSVQFILLREAVILGGGSEASTGIFLWLWLMISSAGAITAGSSGVNSLRKLMLNLVYASIASVVLYLAVTSLLLKPGEVPSFYKSLIIISATVAPATFMSSFVFIRLMLIRKKVTNRQPGNSFGLETVGSIVAGLFTTFCISAHISNFQIYFIVLVMALISVFTLLGNSRATRITAWIAGAALLFVIAFFKPDPIIRGILLKGVKVESCNDTPFGNITTGFYGGERTIYYDHRPLFMSGDIIRTEENIHYALLQEDKPKKVLIISGGIKNHIDQIRKYGVSEVTYIEYDPGIIAAENARDTIVGSMEVRVIKSDPVRFLRKNSSRFDAIIQLTPPPSTLSVNRYFTIEYFRLVKQNLSADGIFLCTPMPYYNYPPGSYRKSLSPVYNSLTDVFRNIVIIPGSLLYIVASDGKLSGEISRLATERGVKNDYVNSDYLVDDEIIRKGELIRTDINVNEGINSAVRPISAWYSNSLALEMRGVRGRILLLVILCLLPFLLVRRGGFLMFSSSASLAGFGMVIIFMLQVVIGSMYMLSAVVLSLLMAGLAIGASGELVKIKLSLVPASICLSVVYTLTGLLALRLVSLNPAFFMIIISILLFAAGYLTGKVFSILTFTSADKAASGIYASDLAGSALGYMIVSTVLVPLAGITGASLILAAFILLPAFLVSIVIKH